MSRQKYLTVLFGGTALIAALAAVAVQYIRTSGIAGPEPSNDFRNTSLGILTFLVAVFIASGLAACHHGIKWWLEPKDEWVTLDPERETFPRRLTDFIDL